MLNAHFDEVRSKLDRLNALSDSINSLERQFDEANSIFRETLKCSTDRLSTIARTLGSKSIRHGRVYQAAKLAVDQNQSECQRACVRFEQANKDHQFAKKAILEAEQRLKEITKPLILNSDNNNSITIHVEDPSLGIDKLGLTDETINGGDPQDSPCDQDIAFKNPPQTPSTASSSSLSLSSPSLSSSCSQHSNSLDRVETVNHHASSDPLINDTTTKKPDIRTEDLTNAQSIDTNQDKTRPGNLQNGLTEEKTVDVQDTHRATTKQIVSDAAKLSEQLNQAIMRLDEAERRRQQSEKQHLDCANRLMDAKENLVRLEREHGHSIRKSQLYFDEAKQFNAKLDSVKGSICRISKDILAAKKAYAQTLSELEQFSEDLHLNSSQSV